VLSLIVPLKVKVGAAAVQEVSVWVAGLTVAVAESASEGGLTGVLQDNVYVAELEAAVTGLVTTRTAWPELGSPDGVIVSGSAAMVPGAVKFRVAGAESWPLDCAQ
jgi:hypothetical protein